MGKEKTSGSSSGGIGFMGALALVIITLKLLPIEPVASWSWVWVLSPLWIGLALLLFVIVASMSAVTGVSLLDRIIQGRTPKIKDED
jgi:small Trp-rich protein